MTMPEANTRARSRADPSGRPPRRAGAYASRMPGAGASARRQLGGVLLAAWLLAVLVPVPRGQAQVIYRHQDDKGVVHLSDRRLNKDYRPFYYLRMPPSVDRDKLMAFIRYHGRRHKVDPELVRAMVEVESGFEITAVSPKGAQGLMQIMPKTGKDLELDDPFDGSENLEAGVRYMKSLLDAFGSLDLALAAYNAGPGRVRASGGVPDIPETRDYVKKVMGRYGRGR